MTACRLCARPIGDAARLRIAPAPSGAQEFEASAEAARARVCTLTIVACSACGLVQSASPPVRYHRTAISAAGVSPAMRAHRLGQAGRLLAALPATGRRIALVGCGDGYELPILAEAGFHPEGIGWGLLPRESAPQWPIHDAYPEHGAALPGAPYDAFACYNFLEHAPDPRGFLSAIGASLRPGAAGVVEVPNYGQQREAGRVADYVADHLSYFDAATMHAMVTASGFSVVSLDTVRGGENLEVVLRWNPAVGGRDAGTSRARPPTPDFAAEAARLARVRGALDAFFGQWTELARPALAWGASHQALTLLAGVAESLRPAAILDSAPFKAGKFAPASGIPVVKPTREAVAGAGAVVVIASGYEDEIARTLRGPLEFSGEVWTVTGDALRRLS